MASIWVISTGVCPTIGRLCSSRLPPRSLHLSVNVAGSFGTGLSDWAGHLPTAQKAVWSCRITWCSIWCSSYPQAERLCPYSAGDHSGAPRWTAGQPRHLASSRRELPVHQMHPLLLRQPPNRGPLLLPPSSREPCPFPGWTAEQPCHQASSRRERHTTHLDQGHNSVPRWAAPPCNVKPQRAARLMPWCSGNHQREGHPP